MEPWTIGDEISEVTERNYFSVLEDEPTLGENGTNDLQEERRRELLRPSTFQAGFLSNSFLQPRTNGSYANTIAAIPSRISFPSDVYEFGGNSAVPNSSGSDFGLAWRGTETADFHQQNLKRNRREMPETACSKKPASSLPPRALPSSSSASQSSSASVAGGVTRTLRACDQCHKRKQRCSGRVPCDRCRGANRDCTMARPTSVINPEEAADVKVPSFQMGDANDEESGDSASTVSTAIVNNSLCNNVIRSRYLQVFSEKIAPFLPATCLRVTSTEISWLGLSNQNFSDPGENSISSYSPAAAFQLNIALAMAARACGARPLASALISRARQLGGSLFDVVGDDNCRGFLLLGQYFVGEDSHLSAHYCRIAAGLRPQTSVNALLTNNSGNNNPTHGNNPTYGEGNSIYGQGSIAHGNNYTHGFDLSDPLSLTSSMQIPQLYAPTKAMIDAITINATVVGDAIPRLRSCLRMIDPEGQHFPHIFLYNNHFFHSNGISLEVFEEAHSRIVKLLEIMATAPEPLGTIYAAIGFLCRAVLAWKANLTALAMQMANESLNRLEPFADFLPGRYLPIFHTLAEMSIAIEDKFLTSRVERILTKMAEILPGARVAIAAIRLLKENPNISPS